ncbi:unnamed protein product [Didymodactylos carnosus]|uniref:Uncharacterized protein n=1 Tax=Didymodactylos carnosus TaxID=1234261 RepID=A0A815BHH6_9BILA|nr:unnamed protein product [Didymodactylos carnosus]CAF4052396.1 unnamed protein product [Didymodactylos carnosus]
MMLRAHRLAQGYSGVSKEAVEALVNFLNSGIVPRVRQYGSIGVNGDLIALVMIVAGIFAADIDVVYNGETMKVALATELAEVRPSKPRLREGLAMMSYVIL